MRFLDVARSCAVAIALTMRTSAVVTAGALLLTPVIGCDDVDVKTQEGLIEGLEQNKSMPAVMKQLGEFDADGLKPYGDAMQTRFLEGPDSDHPEHEVTLGMKLLDLGDAKYQKAYIKALKHSNKELAAKAAKMIGQLKIEGAESAFEEAYANAKDLALRQTLIEQGAAIKSEAMASKAKQILEGDLTKETIRTIRVACRAMTAVPDKKLADKLIYSTFYREVRSPHTTLADCSPALTALGPPMIDAAKKALLKTKDNADLSNILRKPGLGYFSYEYVLRELVGLIVSSGSDKAANPLIAVFERKEPIKMPVDLKKLWKERQGMIPGQPDGRTIGAEFQKLRTDWVGVAIPAYQNALLAIPRVGFKNNKGNKKLAKNALIELFKWDETQAKKWEVVTEANGNLEGVYRSVALRALADLDLLDEVWTTDILPEIQDKKYDDPEHFRDEMGIHELPMPILMTGLLGNTIVQLAIYSKADWLEKVYQPLEDRLKLTEMYPKLRTEGAPVHPEDPKEDLSTELQDAFKATSASQADFSKECKKNIIASGDVDPSDKKFLELTVAICAISKRCEKAIPGEAEEEEIAGNRKLCFSHYDIERQLESIREKCVKALPVKATPTEVNSCVDRFKFYKIGEQQVALWQFERSKVLFKKAKECNEGGCWSKILDEQKHILNTQSACTWRDKHDLTDEIKSAWKKGDDTRKNKCKADKKAEYDAALKEWEAAGGTESGESKPNDESTDVVAIMDCAEIACEKDWREEHYRNAPDMLANKAIYELSTEGNKYGEKLLTLYQGNFDPDGYHLDALFRAFRDGAEEKHMLLIDKIIKVPRGKDDAHNRGIRDTMKMLKSHLENKKKQK